jgi:hypothetical protein
MARPIKYISYLIISILSILSVIYYATLPWTQFTLLFEFFVVSGSILYTGYMFIHESKKKDTKDPLMEGLTHHNSGKHHNNFMIDTYFKFVFTYSFSIFLFIIIYSFRQNFDVFKQQEALYFVVEIYVSFILPIFWIVDLCWTGERMRIPKPWRDILLIFIIAFGHCLYKVVADIILNQTFKNVLPFISDYVTIALISLNGYILYDYITFRKNNPGGKKHFILFYDAGECKIEICEESNKKIEENDHKNDDKKDTDNDKIQNKKNSV